MRMVDLIHTKRRGGALSAEQIRWMFERYVANEIPDYQMSALLMAVFFQGLRSDELAVWTEAMLTSGDVFDFSDIPARKVDKHSTGGVGDKVSLCLAPLVAACGIAVPMISGRGLGHTGGTLDKLESIPGFNVNLDGATFARQVAEVGCSLIGQTARIVPSDKRLYALRDVTATVESIPLIASSIMSKKMAEGIDGLVLDVKVGNGAFMKDEALATELATTMIGIGREMGRRVVAVLSDMNQPLGRAVGNAMETWEAIEILHGRGPDDLKEITMVLGEQMLLLGGVATTAVAARAQLQAAIDSGRGLDKFAEIIAFQGGDPAVLHDRAAMAVAEKSTNFAASRSGTVVGFDTEAIGRASMVLGAGRETLADTIDPAVGFLMRARIGDQVFAGQTLVDVFYNDDDRLQRAIEILSPAITIDVQPCDAPPLVYRVIS